jgi:hypothetical protein
VAEVVTPAAEREQAAPGVAPPRRIPFAGRFLVAYGIVMLAFGGLLALLIVLATGSSHRGARWSAWRPDGGDSDAAGQVANHVARQYKTAAEGRQVIAVEARFPQAFSRPITEIAVRETASSGVAGAALPVESTEHSVFFEMCGVGGAAQCNVPGGVSWAEAAVRREALELGLYSLKYLDDVDTVVVFLPLNGTTSTAVHFRDRDLRRALERPLAKTLPVRPAPPLGASDAPEEDAIERLTRPHWFRARFQQGPVGSTILVLDPPVVQTQPGTQP